MMKKRIVSLALAVSMVGSLTACGGGAAKTEDKETAGAADTTAAKADETEAAADGKTHLKWAMWDKDLTVYYKALVEAYEKAHPDVTVELVDLGSSDYSTVLTTQLTGNGADFDVVSIKDVPGYMALVNKGVLEPLDPYIEKDGVDLSGYKGLTDQVKVDGKMYELPFKSDFWVVYYNKDVFDNAGVEYPTNDMTLEQYDEIAKKLTNTEPGQEVYGSHYHVWRSTVQMFGMIDGEHTILDGNYDYLKPYYDIILDEQENGVCQDYATLKTSNLHYSGAFSQGNVGMMNMGTWFISTLIDKVKSGEYTDCANWGIVKYPHPEGVEAGSTAAQITSLSIPTSAPNKEAAWDFMKFVCGEEGAAVLASTGNFPAIMTEETMNTIASTEGFPEDENSKAALETVNLYLEMPVDVKSPEVETVLNEAHDNIMAGNMTVEEGIADMNERVAAVLGE